MIQTPGQIICPKCNHKMPRYTGTRSQYFSCGQCCTYFSDIGHVIKIEGDFVKKMESRIPKGAIAEFDNVSYVVVGLLIGKEVASFYYWNEYLLYNPDHGYITLSEYNGHWNLVQPITSPSKSGSSYSYERVKYELFSKYSMFYAAADGEFGWNLIPKNDTKVHEYIAPPYSLLREEHEGSIEWYQAQYITPKEVRDAFKKSTKIDTAAPKGAYSNAPNTYKDLPEVALKYSIVAIGALILVVLLQSFIVPSARVFSETMSIDTVSSKTLAAKTFVSQDFNLNSTTGYSSLRVVLEAPVDNSWVEAEVNLINQKTDDEFNTELGVEYYHGVDGGESWSEGETSNDKILSMVPDGTYRLSITPHTETVPNFNNAPMDYKTKSYTIHIDQNTTITSNYVLVVLLIIAYPIYAYIKRNGKESSRWALSEYGNG